MYPKKSDEFPQHKNTQPSFAKGFTMPKHGDEDSIPEFLKRLYSQQGHIITKVNIQVYDDGCLASDHDYRIYRAKLNIEAGDIKADIDWIRDMNNPSSIIRTVHYFCINAIVSGLSDKVYINNIKPNNSSQILPLIMQQLPMLEHELIDLNYIQVFKKADDVGEHVNNLRKQGNYDKSYKYACQKCMSLYSDVLGIKKSFAFRNRPKSDKKQHLKLPTPSSFINNLKGDFGKLINELSKAKITKKSTSLKLK